MTGEAGQPPASPPDIVYRLRRDERNEELRYSLRSLANLAHGAVWCVGYKPAWVDAGFVPTERIVPRFHNAINALRTACEVTPEFVLMDDDFYITEPIAEVPANHHGTLEQRAQTAHGTGYRDSLSATAKYLARHGKPALNYELHQPILIDSARMADVLDATKDQSTPLQARSLYANWWGIPSTEAEDCKVRAKTDPLPAGPFLSTEDGAFSAVRPYLQSFFPDPSPYERAERMAA